MDLSEWLASRSIKFLLRRFNHLWKTSTHSLRCVTIAMDLSEWLAFVCARYNDTRSIIIFLLLRFNHSRKTHSYRCFASLCYDSTVAYHFLANISKTKAPTIPTANYTVVGGKKLFGILSSVTFLKRKSKGMRERHTWTMGSPYNQRYWKQSGEEELRKRRW